MSNSPYYINHSCKCVLITSPKSACTVLQHAFIKEICKIKTNEDPRIIANRGGFEQMDYNLIPNDYTIYWGIRNPFDRIVSCYFNKFILYGNNRLNKNNLEPFSDKLLENIKIDYNEITFNKMLVGIEHLMKHQNINNHFNNQINMKAYNIIKNHPNLIIFDINNIPDIFNINYKLNVTNKPKNIIMRDLCDIKTIDININELSKDNLINSLGLVKKIYNMDYLIFKKYGFYI